MDSSSPRIYIIAGEASGDLHGSNLIAQLKAQHPDAQIRCWGGDKMRAAGGDLVKHYREMAFMGFVEVISHLGKIRRNLQLCQKDIARWKPDVVVLIDYAGFNLRIAEYTKGLGIKTVYYISPKLWAWNQSRVKKIKAYVDKMLVILPFEVEFYQKHGVTVEYVGNPLVDAIAPFTPHPEFRKANQLDERPIIAVLPGSRKQEIENMLYYMVSIIPPYLRDYQFVIAAMGTQPRSFYEGFRRHESVKVVYDQTYDLLHESAAALVTSGTATLETALFNVPQVVCYRLNGVSYWLIRSLIKVKFISLVNLIMNKAVVKELIQDEFNPTNLMVELDKILPGGPERERVLQDYQQLSQAVGTSGASAQAAQTILHFIHA